MASNDSYMYDLASFVHAETTDESDEEQDAYFHDLLIMMQTYQMEFDAESPAGRLPQCFAREFGDVIAPYVVLQDPNHNELEVHVAKESGELYFDGGWNDLKVIYDLFSGGWVTLTYINPTLLTMRLTTRWGAEVVYPTHDPPVKHLLARVEPNNTLGLSACLNPPVSEAVYERSCFKKITFYDLYSGTLILPWNGFGEFVFEFAYSNVLLIDSTEKQYPCRLNFGVDPEGELACKVSGNGWMDLCTDRGISVGDKVRVSVTQPAHNYVIYVAFYLPMELH